MRISHRYKFIFFANPKTGSESVRALLDPHSDIAGVSFTQTSSRFPFYSHMRPVEARDAFATLRWPFEGYYRFTFVRNPWARLVSLYRMVARNDPRSKLSFRDWLLSTKPAGSGGGGPDTERWRKYGTYSLRAFAGDQDGALLVDDVFRMEDMADLPGTLRRRGVPIPSGAQVPLINISPAANDVAEFFSADLIELVRGRYAEEIARFGYEFPGPASATSPKL